MVISTNLKQDILCGKYDKVFSSLYPDLEKAKQRYIDAVTEFENIYGENREVRLFSAPGRTEIGGNHTDHQHGCVIAGAVNLDVIAVVSENGTNNICIKSKGYDEDVISLDDLEVNQKEYGKASALIRGTVASFVKKGCEVKGFDAYTTSDVLKGSGMSSSAAFEVLVGTIVNAMYFGGKESAVSIAKMAQYAENVYFGKPCGLMDQTASSVGGFIAIDFNDPSVPVVEKIDFDLKENGYCLCIVDVGGDHADLTDDYADITVEMKNVARVFGKEFLRDVSIPEFYKNIAKAREAAGDRGVLRAMHFFADNERVGLEKKALLNKDTNTFLKYVNESGNSSDSLLQNLYSSKAPKNQPISLALAIAKSILKDDGACRVHGGGFAGTIQAFVPLSLADEFGTEMSKVFGQNSCHFLSIRSAGGIEVLA
ncbi:MAG: galactokinase [Clostridia bacterium]|nr:galactokinase [Clostridia bacterium]